MHAKWRLNAWLVGSMAVERNVKFRSSFFCHIILVRNEETKFSKKNPKCIRNQSIHYSSWQCYRLSTDMLFKIWANFNHTSDLRTRALWRALLNSDKHNKTVYFLLHGSRILTYWSWSSTSEQHYHGIYKWYSRFIIIIAKKSCCILMQGFLVVQYVNQERLPF